MSYKKMLMIAAIVVVTMYIITNYVGDLAPKIGLTPTTQ